MSNDFSLSSFPQLETERLLLRETTLQDAEAIFAVLCDPGVTQFDDLDTFTSINSKPQTFKNQRKNKGFSHRES